LSRPAPRQDAFLALFGTTALLAACHQPCDSKLYYCGMDTGSPPGDSDSTPRTISTAGGWDHVASGYFHSCALQDGGATCWGLEDYGQADVPVDAGVMIQSRHEAGLARVIRLVGCHRQVANTVRSNSSHLPLFA